MEERKMGERNMKECFEFNLLADPEYWMSELPVFKKFAPTGDRCSLSPFVYFVCFVVYLGSSCFAAETAVDTVSGRVFLDANGNGQFDAGEKPWRESASPTAWASRPPAADGAYHIKIADDPQIPYKPGRVVSVSWPSGKWPSGRWWRRSSEIRAGEKVNFGLKDEPQKLPFIFVHTSDDHGNGGIYPKLGGLVKQQLGGMARFCINTGDLGYSGPDSMDSMFSTIQANAKTFPVPMIFTPGNHDVAGQPGEWNQPHYGTWGFTKYLGPIRWSFSYGGAHFAGIDWANIKEGKLENAPEAAADWLEQDLKALPQGTRSFVFLHFPTGCPRYYQVISKYKVTHVFAGHNHADREYDFAGIPASTVLNTGSLAALLGVVQENSFEIVHFCGGCKGWDYHNKRCAITKARALFAGLAGRHGAHVEVAGKVLCGLQSLAAGQGPVDIAAEIVPGSAKRCGLRIGDKTPIEVLFAENIVWVAGTPVPFTPREQDKSLAWRLAIENNQLTISANSLFTLSKAVSVDNPSQVACLPRAATPRSRKLTFGVWHGSNQGNTSAGRNSVGNALRGVPLAPERHGGRSLQCYPNGGQIEPCLEFDGSGEEGEVRTGMDVRAKPRKTRNTRKIQDKKI